jgi:hypothetical protein
MKTKPYTYCVLYLSPMKVLRIPLYGKEDIVTLEEVQVSLRTTEPTKFKNLKVEKCVDALNA